MIRLLLRWVLVPALLLAIVFVAWLVGTEAGLRHSVAYVRGRLPQLSIGAVEGRFGGTVVVHDVRWAGDGVVITLRKAALVPRLGSVFGIEYRLARIEAEGLRVLTSPTDAPDDGELLDLPGFAAEQLQLVDAQWSDGVTTVAIDHVTAGVAIGGSQLRVTGVEAVAPQSRASGALVLDLATLLPASARLQFDWRVADVAYAGSFEARTQRGVTAMALDLNSPIAFRSTGATQARAPWRDWTGKLELPSQRVAGLPSPWGDEPVALSLEGRGSEKQATLAGRIEAIGRAWLLENVTLVRAPGTLRIADGRLSEIDGAGTLALAGEVPTDPAQPLALTGTFSAFAIPLPGSATRLDGSVSLAGALVALDIVPNLTVTAPDLPVARLVGRARLTPSTLQAMPLELQFGDGALVVVGPIPRASDVDGAVAVVARAFDPALFARDWPGRLDGAIAFRGRGLLDGVPHGVAQIQTLQGRLRGYPVAADGTIALVDGDVAAVTLDARSGSAHLHGEGHADRDTGLTLALDAPDLAALIPDAAGALSATAQLPGPLTLGATGSARGPDAAFPLPRRVDAKASAIVHRGVSIGVATLMFEAAQGDDGPLAIAADAESLRLSGVDFDRVSVRGDGTTASHTLALDGRRGDLTTSLAASGGWADERWTGTLDSVRIVLLEIADANLRAPVALELGSDVVEIGALCLDGEHGNSCFEAHGTPEAGSASATLEKLPIALATAWVAIPDAVALEGQVDGEGELRWTAAGASEGKLSLRSVRGVWRDPTLPEVDLGYERLALDASWSGAHGEATLDAALLPDGSLHATTVPDGDAQSAGWRTDIALVMPRLDWLEEFVPQFDQVGGHVDANLSLRDWPGAPRLDGLVRIGGFAADLPTLGIRVYDGDIVLVRREGGLDVAGTVRSGDGRLALTGRLDRDAGKPVDLRLRGNDVLVVDRGDARVVAAPDLTIAHDRKILRVGGALGVPVARLDLSRLDAGAERSADVVIVDDPVIAAGPAANWRAKVAVTLGDDVRLTGFGLVGKVSGTVTVSQRARRAATGSGELSVEGRYSALGQVFDIERGRLLFSGGALDNPSLLLTAEQRMGDRSTRVRIAGTARRPELEVSSPQAATQSEAIANLMGRSGAFSFGRYLSPKLYVGYGIGLVSGGEIFTVRYRVGRGIELEANSGAENNAAINYRIER